jgi:iron complex transport system substrate-binding protein
MAALIALGGFPWSAQATGQASEFAILAVDSAQPIVEDWAAAYAAQHPEFVYSVATFSTADELSAHLPDADVVFVEETQAELPIEFECGTISRVYMPLPGLAARYLASQDCGDYVAPDTPLKASFLHFVVSADGQQIAIDRGLLPAVVEVVDQGGVTVRVPQPVRRLITAYGVATYYAYVAGATDRIIAASYVGVRGPASQDAMRRVDPGFDQRFTAMSVMGQQETNIEELAALQPDAVFVSARTQWSAAVEELGIPVIRFEGETPERLKEAMTLTGAILGPDAAYRAATFNAYYDEIVANIRQQTAAFSTLPRVYFSGTEPLRVVSGDMYQTAMIELAGGVSVSQALTGYWNDVNLEQVVLWDPDVIFVPTYGGATVEAITDSEEWQIVRAVQEGRVYQLPQFISPWDTPVPDSILGIIWMAHKLHPDQLDLDCAAQVQHLYRQFYEYAMPVEEAQALCR